MSNLNKINQKVKRINSKFYVLEENTSISLYGETDNYDDIIKALDKCFTFDHLGVIDRVTYTGSRNKIFEPSQEDFSLDKMHVDVLIVGGGIVGLSILRELSKYKLNTLLIEKEADIALNESFGLNGIIYPHELYSKSSNKYKYIKNGLSKIERLCQDLEVKLEKHDHIFFTSNHLQKVFYLKSKKDSLFESKYYTRNELLKKNIDVPKYATGGIIYKSLYSVDPFKLSLSLIENALDNGAHIALSTYLYDMDIENGIIKSVSTNKGKISASIVINCAGINADIVSDLAKDRTFTILQQSSIKAVKEINDMKYGYSLFPYTITKGNRIRNSFFLRPTIYSKRLINKENKPNSITLFDGSVIYGYYGKYSPIKELNTLNKNLLNRCINFNQYLFNGLNETQNLYYKEYLHESTIDNEYIIRKGIFTKNIIEVAGISDSKIPASISISEEVKNFVIDYLKDYIEIKENKTFNLHHNSINRVKDYPNSLKDKMIKNNKDYGNIICECKEISKGEVIDILNSPLKVYSLNGIKRRLGLLYSSCNGSLCDYKIISIISEKKHIELSKILYDKDKSYILYKDSEVSKNE